MIDDVDWVTISMEHGHGLDVKAMLMDMDSKMSLVEISDLIGLSVYTIHSKMRSFGLFRKRDNSGPRGHYNKA